LIPFKNWYDSSKSKFEIYEKKSAYICIKYLGEEKHDNLPKASSDSTCTYASFLKMRDN
jgi:hypothetical protein